MYKFNLKNATLKTIRTWKNITISKVEFKEGNEERYTYNNTRRIALAFTRVLFGNKISIEWTSSSGKNKEMTYRNFRTYIISW